MGFAPPEDAPSPAAQNAAGVDASFAPAPDGASLCGFAVPSFTFGIKFPGIPKFPPFDFPPQFNYGLALNCDLSNPISAKFGFGGGRVSQSDPDSDPDATADL